MHEDMKHQPHVLLEAVPRRQQDATSAFSGGQPPLRAAEPHPNRFLNCFKEGNIVNKCYIECRMISYPLMLAYLLCFKN